MKPKINRFLSPATRLFPLILAGLVPSTAIAADLTWDGGGTTASWTDGANWVGDPTSVTMGTDSIQTFYATGALNLNSNFTGSASTTLGQLNFNGVTSSLVIRLSTTATGTTAGNLIFGTTAPAGGIISVDSTSTASIYLGDSPTVTATGSIYSNVGLTINQNGSGSLIINRPIIKNPDITGNQGLVKTGTGSLSLSGANTYTGATWIMEGTVFPTTMVVASGSSSFGNAANRIRLGNDLPATQGTVINSGPSTTTTMTRGFTVYAGGGRIEQTPSTRTLNVNTAGVNGTGPLTIGGSGTIVFNGTLTHTGSLTKVGSGALTLAATNTFPGDVSLSTGTLNLNHASALGTPTVAIPGIFKIEGGTIDNTSSPSLSVSATTKLVSINADFAFKGTGSLVIGAVGNTLGDAAGTTRTITVSQVSSAAPATLTIASGLANGTTANSLIKAGDSDLYLGGINTYTGTTQVSTGGFGLFETDASLAGTSLNVGGATASSGSGAAYPPKLIGFGTITPPTTFSSPSGGVAGVLAPGSDLNTGTITFADALTFGALSTFSWTLYSTQSDPGAGSVNSGVRYDKVVAIGTAGSVTGQGAIFSIGKIPSVPTSYLDAFWNTNKVWTDIFSGTGAPTSLASVFSSFGGTSVKPNGLVLGQGRFSFSGSSLVWTASVGTTLAYDTWAQDLSNPDFIFDSDGDGLANGLEWVLGGNALASDSPSVLPTPTGSATTGLTLNFTRKEASIAETTLTLEYGDDLTNLSNSVVIDVDGGSFANGVMVTIDQAQTPDAVIINIPAGNAVNGKLFARLKVSRP